MLKKAPNTMKTSAFLVTLAMACIAWTSHGGVIGGPVTNSANGHVYYLLAQTNWTAAEAEAVALGGHLVTINDAEENAWVHQTFSVGRGCVWLRPS